VHFFEVTRVMALEGLEIEARGMNAMDLPQRGTRRAAMVEQRVVEIE